MAVLPCSGCPIRALAAGAVGHPLARPRDMVLTAGPGQSPDAERGGLTARDHDPALVRAGGYAQLARKYPSCSGVWLRRAVITRMIRSRGLPAGNLRGLAT